MSSADQVDILLFQEVRYHVRPEYETNPSLVLAPALDALLWISPQKITKQSLIRHFNRPDDFQDLFKTLQLRTQTTMHAHNLLINKRTYGHDIKHIREEFPEF